MRSARAKEKASGLIGLCCLLETEDDDAARHFPGEDTGHHDRGD